MKNRLAHGETDSRYRRCASAQRVPNAKDDFPEPDTPVKTIRAFRGMSQIYVLEIVFTRSAHANESDRSPVRAIGGKRIIDNVFLHSGTRRPVGHLRFRREFSAVGLPNRHVLSWRGLRIMSNR
ncbi:MAG: hypothetical protein QOJ99_4 [Bryobacterales bacterium]|jgi:hypothetical protein|nr:hypothetical protein [Bryobacterales bacterium]